MLLKNRVDYGLIGVTIKALTNRKGLLMFTKESILKAQLVELNDSYLDGLMTKLEWVTRLNDLVSKAEQLGVNLFEGAN